MLGPFGPNENDLRWRARYASGSQVASLQNANPALGTVSRLPQTTATQGGGGGTPFVRLSRKGTIQAFDVTGVAFGNPPNLPGIKPVGGYHRRIRLEVIASGGSGANSPAASDGPWNVINTILVRDPFNQPIINVDGYGLYLIDLYGGQIGVGGFGNQLTSSPSYSAVVTTTGSFTAPFYIPFELDYDGYCCLPGLSAAAVPQIAITTNASGTVYTTAPNTTAPTLEFRAYSDFWAAPVDAPDLAPPGVGSSAQWSLGQGASNWANATNARIQLPRVGTFIHTLILALRDSSTGVARVDNWPSTDLTFWVDSVPIETEDQGSRYDKMYQQFGVTRPTGVIVYTFRDSVEQLVSQADTHDLDLYTTPATLLEVGGTNGSTGTSPDKVYAYTGELYPVGGVPYTHLAD